MQFRTSRFVSVVVAGSLALTLGVASASGAANKKPAPTAPITPASVSVTPQLGGVKVTWTKSSASGVTYTVTSTPSGKTCVTTATNCFIPVTDSTPWQFSVAAANAIGTSAPSAPTARYSHRVILVVAGQSNANGWESYATDPTTGTNYMSSPYTNGADTHDLITWAPWRVLPSGSSMPTSLDSPQNRGTARVPVDIFGPEIGLARQLWTDKQLPVTVVKAAYPGTFLDGNWTPSTPKLSLPTATGLFPGMVALVKQTMTNDAKYGQLDTIGGFYWYQGEADSAWSVTAPLYQANLTAFIGALRADLPMAPNAPVALVKEDMTSWWNAMESSITPAAYASDMAGNAEVRAADDAVAASLPNVVTVDSAGLSRTNGLIHLTNTSQLTVGQNLALATENMIP